VTGQPPPVRPAPRYSSPGEFVGKYLSHIYAQQVTDTTTALWCPEWWEHPQAVLRLGLLHRTYETAILRGSEALSLWQLVHADPHMRQLFSPTGPFRYCSARHGHKPLITPLPCYWAAAPDWVMGTTPPAPSPTTAAYRAAA